MEAVSKWTPQQVSAWMRGLNDTLQSYVNSFQLLQVSGQCLLNLSHTQLLSLGMSRVGDQELLLEAIELLSALNRLMEQQNLADHLTLVNHLTLADQKLNSAVSCRRKNPSYQNKNSYLPSNDFLSAVVELIAAAKELLSALDRAPVDSDMDLNSTRSRIIHLCLELTSTVQKDCTVFEMEEKVLEVSKSLKSVCEKITSLTFEPCTLERVTISGIKPGQGLGIYIKSTIEGLHLITGTTENSPADQTQRIHPGDELVQVNGQTVVGWQLKHLVECLRTDSDSMVLTLKKKQTENVNPAPVRNLHWRPMLVKAQQPCSTKADPGGATLLDLKSSRFPTASFSPLEGNSSSVKPQDDVLCCSDPDPFVTRMTSVTSDNLQTLNPVKMRQRSSCARSKARPMSMPEVLSRNHSRKGLQRCASNERVSAILEEGCSPVQYRTRPTGRGVDHIRGSQCLLSPDLQHMIHLQSTADRPEARSESRKESRPGSESRSQSRTKSGSILGGLLSRLRLLSH